MSDETIIELAKIAENALFYIALFWGLSRAAVAMFNSEAN